MDINNADDLYRMANSIIGVIKPKQLNPEDFEDLRQSIVVGILEAHKKLSANGKNSVLYMYTCGLGIGLNYLNRYIMPWKRNVVSISDVNSLGLTLESEEDRTVSLELDKDSQDIVKILKILDNKGWVFTHFGIGCKQQSLREIADAHGVHHRTVGRYIDEKLEQIRMLFDYQE